ncbi:hypothetical protein ACFYNM_22280 [Streptomyces spororaveus]|uniref:hypothetical protein n=1 Tax=Streptomyces spororaveus TaxID=284039 RepID=UPI00369993B9
MFGVQVSGEGEGLLMGVLSAPVVEEAVEEELDAAIAEATVMIGPVEGLAAGDEVTLRWDGGGDTGRKYALRIEDAQVGNAVRFRVPGPDIAPCEGGFVVAVTMGR